MSLVTLIASHVLQHVQLSRPRNSFFARSSLFLPYGNSARLLRLLCPASLAMDLQRMVAENQNNPAFLQEPGALNPAPLRMFTYVREQQTQPSVADPEAWAAQDIQSSDSSSAPKSGEECPKEAPPPRSSLALCFTTGAAVHAVHSSPEHLQSAFCTACGVGIQAPVHRVDYLGQEHLCKRNACQHAFSLVPWQKKSFATMSACRGCCPSPQAGTPATRPLPRPAGPHLS